MNEDDLQINIEVNDQATATLARVQAAIEKVGAASQISAEESAAGAAEQQASFELLAASYQKSREEADLMLATEEELNIAQAEAAASAEEMAGSFEVVEEFGNKVHSMLIRLAAQLIVVKAIMDIIKFFTEAVGNAEKANEEFSKGIGDADKTMQDFKTRIGDEILPTLVFFKEELANVEGGALKNKSAFDLFGETLFRTAQVIASVIAIVYDMGVGFVDLVQFGLAVAFDAFKNFGSIIESVGKAMGDFVDGKWSQIGSDIGEISKLSWSTVKKYSDQAATDAQNAFDTLKGIWAKPFTPGSTLSDIIPVKAKDVGVIENLLARAKDAYDKFVADTTEDLANLATTHSDFVDSTSTKLIDLMGKYSETSAKAQESLAKLAETNADAMKRIADQIDGVKEKMKALDETLATTESRNADTLAKAFVKAQDEVAKLQEQLDALNAKTPDSIGENQIKALQTQQKILEEMDPIKRRMLEEEAAQYAHNAEAANDKYNADKAAISEKIKTEQDALDAQSGLQETYASRIAELKKSDVEQAVDNFNTANALAQKQHDDAKKKLQDEIAGLNEKSATTLSNYNEEVAKQNATAANALAKIKQQIAAVKAQQVEELAFYNAKVSAINALVAEAEKERRAANDATFANTKKNIQAEIDLYASLAQAISRVNSAKGISAIPSAPSVSSVPSSMKHAEGGIFTQPTWGMIGEAGAEAVIPLDKMGGGGFGTTINITVNGDVTGEELIEKIGDRLVGMLKLSTATV